MRGRCDSHRGILVNRFEQGSEVVQFILAVPLLLFVLFAVVQVGGMMLSANQVGADITRACRQLDAAGLMRTTDKETFVKEGILGASTQLKGENLQVENVHAKSDTAISEVRLQSEGSIAQRTSTTTLSYDVSYEVPSILAFPGLSGRRLARHVDCAFVDGRAIEVSLGEAL